MVRGNPEEPHYGPVRFVTIYEIEDSGGRLIYEAISYTSGLRGAVFRAGTTDWVAELCQHTLDMRDPEEEPLREALTKIMGDAMD